MEPAKKNEPTTDPKVIEKKWSKELLAAGWTVLPNVLFHRQQALGLDPLDINILLHIASYWWNPGDKPHPSKKTIAAAIGVDARTVQRRIARMERVKFIRREQRRISGTGSKTNLYHLEGLITQAKPYASEMVAAQQEKGAARKALAAKKGRPSLRVVKHHER